MLHLATMAISETHLTCFQNWITAPFLVATIVVAQDTVEDTSSGVLCYTSGLVEECKKCEVEGMQMV